MKHEKKNIPVYDLCMLHPMRLHKDICAGPFLDFCQIRDKLIIPHRHAYYHILLFTRASGTFTIDFEQYEIKPGRIYFMIPGQVHRWNISEEKDGFTINFTENLFSSFIAKPQYLEQFTFLRGIPSDSVIDLNESDTKEAIIFFNKVINELRNQDSFSIDQVCFHLMSLFICASRRSYLPYKKQIPEQNQSTLFNFRKLVNLHFAEKKLPKEYAEMLHVTPNYLNSLCKDLSAKTAGEIIRDRILLEAKRYLVNLDISISEISFKLNFTDNSYFTKFFKKYSGFTPDEFRNSYFK